ncbi:hypothetical protein BDV59DRAFT_144701 [Aspergillus ambiguus]|uniref:putative cell wall anchored protein n=1 Tax=Aspergillus ambiguus TaxID=176160 RepID=UPI003CCD80BC
MLMWRAILPLTTLLVCTLAIGTDPVDNFCRRLNHQSTIKDGKLYIDGGVETYAEKDDDGQVESARILGYNTQLIEVDMTSSWDWKDNISITAVDKTANPSTGTEPPLVVRGALYSGPTTDSKIYLYGGTTSSVNTSFPGFKPPTSSQYTLWSYDPAEDRWDQYDVTEDVPYSPAGGSYTEAPNLGQAFYLNGFIDSGTSNGLEHMSNFRRYLDGLVVIDLPTQVAMNVSTVWLRRSPRAKGGMVYIPGAGSQGMLVAMGGVTKPTSDSSASNDGTYVTFDQIDFLDVESIADDSRNATWLVQKTVGDIPSPRTDFCLVAASAKDNSSHNVYLYGGRGANEDYDEVYILSMPSFTWTRVYSGESPRYGHTCHLVGNRQMLTVGGATSDDLTSTCDWEREGVAIFDMTDLKWGSVYRSAAPEYQVPRPVLRTIGGEPDGNARMKEPPHGFSTRQIAQFFRTPLDNGTEEDALEREGLDPRDVSGIVIGSVGGAALILGSVYFWIRQRKRQDSDAESEPWTEEKSTSWREDKGPSWTEHRDFAYVGATTCRNPAGQQVELPDSTRPPAQLPATSALQEMDANHVRELPTTK